MASEDSSDSASNSDTRVQWQTVAFGQGVTISVDTTTPPPAVVFTVQMDTIGLDVTYRLLLCCNGGVDILQSEPTTHNLRELITRPASTIVLQYDPVARTAHLPHFTMHLKLYELGNMYTVDQQDITPLRSVYRIVENHETNFSGWTQEINSRIVLINNMIDSVLKPPLDDDSA